MYNRREIHGRNDNNAIVVKKYMTVDPIFSGVKTRGEIVNPIRSKTNRLYLGSVDPLTAQNWSKECGHAVGTKAFAAYAKKKLMSGDWAHYRAPKERMHYNGHGVLGV